MRLRTLFFIALLTYVILGLSAYWFAPVRADNLIVGTTGDVPVNLITTQVGEDLVIVSGVVGDAPVNVVAHTEGKLVARLYWTGMIGDQPVEPAEVVIEESTDPERDR